MTRLSLVFVWVFLISASFSQAAELFFTSKTADGGAVEAIRVNPEDGKITNHRVLYQAADFELPKKLRQHPVSGRLLASSASETPANLVLLNPADPTAEPITIDLPLLPDEIRAFGENQFVVAADDGLIVVIDGNNGEISHQFNTRNELKPSANKPEDIHLLPGGEAALVSFQKDSKTGKHTGSRIILFSLPDLNPLADIALPRDAPELHIEGNPKEQGPSPEVVLTFPELNTAVISLDLYGALAFTDLDALLEGRLSNYSTLATSRDGEYGKAFPDRVTAFEHEGRTLLLVSNASAEGLVLIDPAERKIIRHFDAPTGAETPVQVSQSPAVLATVLSGKVKGRGDESLSKVAEPLPQLRVYTMENELTEAIYPLPSNAATLTAVPGSTLVACGLNDNSVVIVDTKDGTLRDQKPTTGRMARIIPSAKE